MQKITREKHIARGKNAQVSAWHGGRYEKVRQNEAQERQEKCKVEIAAILEKYGMEMQVLYPAAPVIVIKPV